MDQKVKQLFLQTLSPNETIRNGAEAQLSTLEKNEDFLNYIRTALLTKEADKQLQQIASIYFMNTIAKNWKSPEMERIVRDFECNILELIKCDIRYPKLAYLKIMSCILQNSSSQVIQNLLGVAILNLKSENTVDNKAALIFLEELIRTSDCSFSSGKSINFIFTECGDIFNHRFTTLLMAREYSLCALAYKILTKAYGTYKTPQYLAREEVAIGYLNMTLSLVGSEAINTESYQKLIKGALSFLLKVSTKSVKQYFKDKNLIEFFTSSNNLNSIYSAFVYTLTHHSKLDHYHNRSSIICSDFFLLYASSNLTRDIIKRNYTFLLNDFILPAQAYNESMKEKFEYYPEDYLRVRYDYATDLRNSTQELFKDIVSIDKSIEMEVVYTLKNFLDQGTNELTAPLRYGAIGLFADIQGSIVSIYKESGYNAFVKAYIFEDLKSPFEYLISQALYFLTLAESIDIPDNSVVDSINIMIGFVKPSAPIDENSSSILAVESCMALKVFFYNDSLRGLFSGVINSIFEKILILSKVFFLESLSTLMDCIIDCYKNEIMDYAPSFVNAICNVFLESLLKGEDDDGGKFSALSGSLNTILRLVYAAQEKTEIIKLIYSVTSKVVFFIFKHEKFDFYQEGFDLMNAFLFTLKYIDESMFEIFMLILSSDKEELVLYSDELSDFIDNYLSYGRDKLITPVTLNLIYEIINLLMPKEGEDMGNFSDDYEAALRIIDSLIINAGSAVHTSSPTFVSGIVSKIIGHLESVADSSRLTLFTIEIVMNCWIIAPDATISALGQFVGDFFDLVITSKRYFRRVYDKKLFLLFVAHLLKSDVNLPIDFRSLTNVFVEILTSLPEAMKHRKELKDEAENEDVDEEDEELDYDEVSGDTENSIYEDIYFETVLDNFDALGYVSQTLHGISTQNKAFSANFLSCLTRDQISQIQEVLKGINNSA